MPFVLCLQKHFRTSHWILLLLLLFPAQFLLVACPHDWVWCVFAVVHPWSQVLFVYVRGRTDYIQESKNGQRTSLLQLQVRGGKTSKHCIQRYTRCWASHKWIQAKEVRSPYTLMVGVRNPKNCMRRKSKIGNNIRERARTELEFWIP